MQPTTRPAHEHAREICRDEIERFLDRSCILDRVTLQAMYGNRYALNMLDDWLRRHRSMTLTQASANDVRELFRSSHWDRVARCCESLLGLITRFYASLRECKFRSDDPIQTLIEQELAAAASQRTAARIKQRDRQNPPLVFRQTSVL